MRTMAFSRRLAGQSHKLLKSCSKGHVNTLRTFYSINVSSVYRPAAITSLPSAAWQSKRAFSSSSRCSITGEEPPSAKAYISSGVVAGASNPVNVKKVLVIGSGGLSIGQAGEFDYSG